VPSLRISSHFPAPIVNGGRDKTMKIKEFLTLKISWPWLLIKTHGIPLCIAHRHLPPTYLLSQNLKNLSWTDGARHQHRLY